MKRRNPARHKREWARAYGSPERVAWVQSQPCCVCASRPSENAHTQSGGMGRKADASTIVPLCAKCHSLQHHGRLAEHKDYLRFCATVLQARWELHQAQ